MATNDGKPSSAPVLPFEYVYVDSELIWPCTDCLPWQVDLYLHPRDGAVMVRESHAVVCDIWTRVNYST